MYGRVDLARYSAAASTARNCFIRYAGGLSSRAGSLFVGYSKQTGRAYPPRLLTFQFNLNQGLCLEFGNFYMRVIQNGAFVVDRTLSIVGITQANPAVITVGPTSGGNTVTAINTAVVRSYEPGEHVTLAGGTFSSPAVVAVTNTLLLALEVNDGGTGVYDIADTISLTGGSQTTPAQLTVTHTQVTGASIANAGAGGTDGAQVVTGTTGTGTKFTANVTIAGGLITSVDSIATGGDYTVNPTAPAAEPVTGAGAGAQLDLSIGVLAFTITNPGVFTSNGPGTFTQNTTSGSGLAATFKNAIFGINAATFSDPGVYTVFPTNPVAQDTTDGMGLGATFTCTSATVGAMDTGDWIEISGVGGMTELNGGTFVVTKLSSTTYSLADVFGNNIDSTAYTAFTSGGIAERIYTLETIYDEVDLAFLKITQSADVMSICLVNQDTNVEYIPQDLARTTNSDWTFEPVVTTATVDAPTDLTGVASSSGSTNYQYVVTSVDPKNGTESIASNIASISSAVNIAATAGSIQLSWTPVDGVSQYNVYKANPVFDFAIPAGVEFGFAGTAFGTQFVDSNIVADSSQVPPKHQNPFARGQIIGASPSMTGSGYTTATVAITTSTGSGAIIRAIVQSGGIAAYIVDNPGEDYATTDTAAVSGDGTGATLILNVGPETGTYPAVPTYFQERRGYGFTLNQPDTYFFSQPGSFKDFDTRIPTLASDAITGNPWAVQVNGIQAMLNRPGGLVVFTGREAWQLTGTGGSSLNPQPITPSTQQAQPQAFNGCHSHVPPVGIDNEILYVQAKGSIVRDLSYNYFANVYTGSDLTLNSSHLFTGYQIQEWGWAEEPFKILPAVRDDGTALCLTFVKPQEVAGWTRWDTNGSFVSTTVVTEVPVDAVYLATQRQPVQGSAYMIERMDNRIWNSAEEAWCVDCGLRLGQPEPAATLNVSSATGAGTIPSITVTSGGTGYGSATTATVVDDDGEGPGSGCTVALTIVAGVITAATPTGGTGYTYPQIVVYDPSNSGSGAVLTAALLNSATAVATGGTPFTSGNVGDVIRSGGGIMTITAFNSTTNVTVNITSPIVAITVDAAGNRRPLPQTSGNWTMTTPVTEVSELMHLAGLTVTGTYDGKAIPPTVVPPSGVITLPAAASAVTVGLGFVMQAQSPYFSVQGQSVEGHRKKVADVVVRVEASLGFTVGTNQPDGSTFSPIQIAPVWEDMQPVEKATASFNRAPYGSDVEPLWTGDSKFIPVMSGFGVPGQVCVQQALPFPLNLLAFIPDILPGDVPQVQEPKSARSGQNQ
jgi:hypothetical protein